MLEISSIDDDVNDMEGREDYDNGIFGPEDYRNLLKLQEKALFSSKNRNSTP